MKKIVQNFNNLIKKTIFKVQNKTNNNFKISNFNKYLIFLISLLFFYLFYLLIPVLYEKTWVQSNIESKLLKEFKINFSVSSNISYRILPAPHFLIKDSKIFKADSDKISSIADIKNLKVFINQDSFFNKNKMNIKLVKIDNANFSILKNDIKLLKEISNNKFSNKKIEINNSKIFFKDNLDETLAIIKIKKASLLLEDESLLNLFNLNGEVFNIPFTFNYKTKFNYVNTEEIYITANKLKLNFFDTYNDDENNLNNRKNTISLLNTSIKTDYKIEDDRVIFNSNNLRIKNAKVDYKGELAINPFDLYLDINIDDYDLFNLLKNNSILNELLKTNLLFNNNISVNTSIAIKSNFSKKIFQKAKINFNIIDGKINIDKTKLFNKKIGTVEIERSNLYLKNDRLILNSNFLIDIKNLDELFTLLQTNKKYRKKIKNILINLEYDFLTKQIKFNNFKIDDNEVNDQLYRIIEGFSDNNLNKRNKSKRLLNELFKHYEG